MAAPPVIAVILTYLNWRWIFFLTGAIGCFGRFGGAANISHPRCTLG